MNQTVSSRQLHALLFVSMLSPFLRLVPTAVTRQAGAASWVSTALSLIPAFLLFVMLRRLLRNTGSQGLAQGILQTMGRFPGCVLLSLWTLWLIFHSGFLLCSGADRFIATIYPGTSPTVFIAVTILVCTIAASGAILPMARLSELLRPLLLAVILPVLLFSLEEVEPAFLLPVTPQQTPSILKAVPLGTEAVSAALVNGAFLQQFVKTTGQKPRLPLFLLWVTILGTVFCAVCVGSLGKTYTAAVAYPFFILARDLSIISGVERIEAVVAALWFLPDFVLITAELIIAEENLRAITRRTHEPPGIFGILAAAGLAVAAAFLFPADSQSMLRWSEQVIPGIHLGWAYLAVPALLLVSRLRKKF